MSKQRLSARPPKSEPPQAPAQSSSDVRARLTRYLLSVIEDPKASSERRDEMAQCLARMEAYARPIAPRAPGRPRSAAKPPKPREYFSKKREAKIAAKTAHNGSAWEGLINGSGAAEHGVEE